MAAKRIDTTKYWMAISSIVGIGIRTVQKLIEKFGLLENVFSASAEQITLLTGINFKLSCEIVNLSKELPKFEKFILQMYSLGIEVLCPNSPEYPSLLKLTGDYPCIIYKKGVSY